MSGKRKRLKEETTGIKVPKKVCLFCLSGDINELELGELITYKDITVHYFCLLLSSGLNQNGKPSDKRTIKGFLPKDILTEQKRGNRLRCVFCEHKGATIGCCVGSCHKVFHLPCGRQRGTLHQFFDTYRSFCPVHEEDQRSSSTYQSPHTEGATCSICLSTVDTSSSTDSIHLSCCKKARFHRLCLQQYALSAGKHFYKCPLCNCLQEFQKEMLNRGIYIPDQDASWERQPNAFSELLERHGTCDSLECKCPLGRNHNAETGLYDLVLCQSCGSFGSHRACRGLTRIGISLLCPVCKEIEQSRNANGSAESTCQNSAGNSHHSQAGSSSLLDCPCRCSELEPFASCSSSSGDALGEDVDVDVENSDDESGHVPGSNLGNFERGRLKGTKSKGGYGGGRCNNCAQLLKNIRVTSSGVMERCLLLPRVIVPRIDSLLPIKDGTVKFSRTVYKMKMYLYAGKYRYNQASGLLTKKNSYIISGDYKKANMPYYKKANKMKKASCTKQVRITDDVTRECVPDKKVKKPHKKNSATEVSPSGSNKLQDQSNIIMYMLVGPLESFVEGDVKFMPSNEEERSPPADGSKVDIMPVKKKENSLMKIDMVKQVPVREEKRSQTKLTNLQRAFVKKEIDEVELDQVEIEKVSSLRKLTLHMRNLKSESRQVKSVISRRKGLSFKASTTQLKLDMIWKRVLTKSSTVLKGEEEVATLPPMTSTLEPKAVMPKQGNLVKKQVKLNVMDSQLELIHSRLAGTDYQITDANMNPHPPPRTVADITRMDPESTDANITRMDSQSTDADITRMDPESTDANITRMDPESTDADITIMDPENTDADITRMDSQSTDANITRMDSQSTDADITRMDSQSTDADITRTDSQSTHANITRMDSQSTHANITDMDDPQSTDANITDMDDPQSTDAIITGMDDSQSTDAIITGMDDSQSTDANITSMDAPQSTDADITSMDDPQSTDASITSMDDPQSTDASITRTDPQSTDADITRMEDPQSTDADITKTDSQSTHASITRTDSQSTDANSNISRMDPHPHINDADMTRMDSLSTDANITSMDDPQSTDADTTRTDSQNTDADTSSVFKELVQAQSRESAASEFQLPTAIHEKLSDPPSVSQSTPSSVFQELVQAQSQDAVASEFQLPTAIIYENLSKVEKETNENSFPCKKGDCLDSCPHLEEVDINSSTCTLRINALLPKDNNSIAPSLAGENENVNALSRHRPKKGHSGRKSFKQQTLFGFLRKKDGNL